VGELARRAAQTAGLAADMDTDVPTAAKATATEAPATDLPTSPPASGRASSAPSAQDVRAEARVRCANDHARINSAVDALKLHFGSDCWMFWHLNYANNPTIRVGAVHVAGALFVIL
jgi:hypothetical protein